MQFFLHSLCTVLSVFMASYPLIFAGYPPIFYPFTQDINYDFTKKSFFQNNYTLYIFLLVLAFFYIPPSSRYILVFLAIVMCN